MKFIEDVSNVIRNCFLPVSLGGGIRDIDSAAILFRNGADKIVLNSSVFLNPELIEKIAGIYGSQSIIASVEFKEINNDYFVFIENGQRKIDKNLNFYFQYLEKLQIGEVLLNSIDKDGTGQGLLIDSLNIVHESFSKPIILSGGAGNEKHLFQGLSNPKINAVATANLFNFIGDGLPNARNYLLNKGCKLAIW